MKNKEIGNRLSKIMTKLDELGVFYGNNYSGKYHEKYPHSGYWFSLDLDKHRGGFESNIYYDGENIKCIAVGDGITPTEMLLDLLEKSYDEICKELDMVKLENINQLEVDALLYNYDFGNYKVLKFNKEDVEFEIEITDNLPTNHEDIINQLNARDELDIFNGNWFIVKEKQ